jgi:glutaconyl-CoA/methylmalonyl-CoA decarboxylase subunit delta
MNVWIGILEAFEISILSIFIVFLILYFVSLLVGLLKHLTLKPKEKKFGIEDIKDEDMMVAALVASIEYRQTHQTDFKIKSIREIKK